MHVIHKIPGSIKYKNIHNYDEPKIAKNFSGQSPESFLRDFYSKATISRVVQSTPVRSRRRRNISLGSLFPGSVKRDSPGWTLNLTTWFIVGHHRLDLCWQCQAACRRKSVPRGSRVYTLNEPLPEISRSAARDKRLTEISAGPANRCLRVRNQSTISQTSKS